jgi:hypothetical protein
VAAETVKVRLGGRNEAFANVDWPADRSVVRFTDKLIHPLEPDTKRLAIFGGALCELVKTLLTWVTIKMGCYLLLQNVDSCSQ